MGFLKKIASMFIADREEDDDEEAVPANAHLYLKSMAGKDLYEIKGKAKLKISLLPGKELVVMKIRNGGMDVYDTVVSCPLPKTVDARTELQQMLRTLIGDIYDALRAGTMEMKIPTNEYDLFLYIRKRPSIGIDMDLLEEELSQGRRDHLVSEFLSALDRNSRLDVYVVPKSLANVTALRILRDAWKKYPMVRFLEVESGAGEDFLYWSSQVIQETMRKEPNVAVVGIGVIGKKPPFGVNLKNDEFSSVVQKAAVLSKQDMNTRERMIDAQTAGHAAGISEVGRQQNKDEEFITKTIADLAVEEAVFRMSEEDAREIVNAVHSSESEEHGRLRIIHAPRFDRILLLNLVVDAEDGFMVEVKNGEILYYKDRVGKLQDLYGWTFVEEDWCQAPQDVSVEELEEEAGLVAMEGKYVRELDETLTGNIGKSVSASFESLQKLVTRYDRIGMDMIHQIELLQFVDIIKNNNSFYGDSIESMIREILA